MFKYSFKYIIIGQKYKVSDPYIGLIRWQVPADRQGAEKQNGEKTKMKMQIHKMIWRFCDM